jgi:hypothetical protein
LPLLAVFASTLAAAQTTVYESKDKAGPVFSDKPSAGAAVVDLPPPNVVAGPKPAPVAAPQPAVAAAYRSLNIASPANGATLHTNTGEFELSARLNPALRPADSLRIKLDGQWLSSTFRSTRLRVTASDWQAAANASTVEHSVQLVVVDAQGAVLIESAPLRFYVHRASVAGKR